MKLPAVLLAGKGRLADMPPPPVMTVLCVSVTVEGVGGGVDVVTVKVTLLLATPPTVTVTAPVVAPFGTVATMRLALQPEPAVASVPLKRTLLLPCEAPKLLPLIVTAAPAAPVVGDRLVTFGPAGAASATVQVKLLALDRLPSEALALTV